VSFGTLLDATLGAGSHDLATLSHRGASSQLCSGDDQRAGAQGDAGESENQHAVYYGVARQILLAAQFGGGGLVDQIERATLG
jgi:hypothetical protein